MEIWHVFSLFLEQESKKHKAILTKNRVFFVWAQKTSEIPTFTIGIQQWKSGIFFIVFWRMKGK